MSAWESISQVDATPGGDERGKLAFKALIHRSVTTRVRPSQLLAPVFVITGVASSSSSSDELFASSSPSRIDLTLLMIRLACFEPGFDFFDLNLLYGFERWGLDLDLGGGILET